MNLLELSPERNTETFVNNFAKHFGSKLDLSNMSLSEGVASLKKVRGKIKAIKESKHFHSSERIPAYLKLLMLEESLEAFVKESQMSAKQNLTFNQILKKAALGENVARHFAALRKQGISENLIRVLESKETSIKFIRKIVESKSSTKRTITESEVEQAQVVLAAQDLVDQVQKMIENLSDMQVKDLPALVDGIRSEMGTEQASQFSDSVSNSLRSVIDSLSGSKQELDSALGIITGEEMEVPGEIGSEEPELDLDQEIGSEEPELGLDQEEEEVEPADLTDLGRERR